MKLFLTFDGGGCVGIMGSVGATAKNVWRSASYAIWTFVEQGALIAVPRLILWPLAANILGKEAFGIFVTAYAVSLIIGVQPSNGLATGLLRHLSDYDEGKRTQFCGVALRLSHKAVLVIIVIGLACIAAVGLAEFVSWRLLNCIIPLTVSLYPENQTHLFLTERRFDRKFQQRALWFVLRTTINLVGGLCGALWAGVVGLAWGFTLGNAVVYLVLRLRCRSWLTPLGDARAPRILKKVWLQITIAGIIAVSGPYLNRLILSGIGGFGDTADLVAATSVTLIFLAPISCVGGLLLSMISRYSSIRQLSRRAKVQWILALLFGAVVCPLALRHFGATIVGVLYPAFGSESMRLLNIVMWLLFSETLVSLSRPFVMKFGSIRSVPIVNSVSLLATFLPTVYLIPRYGVTGAAWAIVIGSSVTGLMWFASAGRLYFKPARVCTEVCFSADQSCDS